MGEFRFNTKDSISKFSRSLLSQLPINSPINNKLIVYFVKELYSYHPEYDINKKQCNYITTNYDDIDDLTTRTYTNFVIHFEDYTTKQFSNKKCLTNIPLVKEFKMPFGKHKGKSIFYIKTEDINYLNWLLNQDINKKIKEEIQKQLI